MRRPNGMAKASAAKAKRTASSQPGVMLSRAPLSTRNEAPQMTVTATRASSKAHKGMSRRFCILSIIRSSRGNVHWGRTPAPEDESCGVVATASANSGGN